MPDFLHLHCHTQFSLLDGAARIEDMMQKAANDGQKGVALTDHGNMFGAFKFVNEANKAGVKPILGCEFYMVEDRHKKSFAKAAGEKDKRYHQLLLAKNRKGYENLSKLCSLGYVEGLYSKFPRIDKELLLQYHEGVIGTSCCIGAEIPQAILHGDLEKAESLVKWWLDLLGEDFYIELQRHRGLENISYKNEFGQLIDSGKSQEDINQTLLTFAKKYGIKVIATNDSHYVEEEDSDPHDVLLCINTGSLISDPKGQLKGQRFAFPSNDFYFKTKMQMEQTFSDLPFALDNTLEIYDKIDALDLARDVVLPKYPLPPGFQTEMQYLRHLTYEGAKARYGELKAHITERLDFELSVIEASGYPGYFLIVQDFTTTARQMDVWVGPGRGSAAGSAVAFCLGITNIDPIKYDLLFERFLNPERISMPDIDIDFDDVGRQKVIDYVVDKYGHNQVAQIITYGTMAAKSSIRDVGRVLNIPLDQVDKIAKSIPGNASLRELFEGKELSDKLKGKFRSEEIEQAKQLRQMGAQPDLIGQTIRMEQRLEGSFLNTFLNACAIVITPDEVSKYVPVSVAKDSDLLVSQFDNSVAEDAGLLKMDFLGLRTLSILKDAIGLVKWRHKVDIDPDAIPLDDEKTYELFQRGETIGIFQYESQGMQKYMRQLKPTTFDDLIAMNALYRPGPMDYIEDFIARKHGKQEIIYDLPEMEEYLKDTYGITVYQEQVMLLSQKLAGFSKGQADMLRKGMGKKKKAIIDELYPKFIAGGEANGHPSQKLEKIWNDWEKFASYAFNKSHSTCYAFIAFQTAYLKAHYPEEFMASILTHNKTDISKVNFFLQECKRMGVRVKPPSVNSSYKDFSVNDEGKVVIGLSALKGVGDGPVDALVKERDENGNFSDLADMMRRIDFSAINKRVMESLAKAGALDDLGVERAQLFAPIGNDQTYIEGMIKYGQSHQRQEAELQNSLFGDMDVNFAQEPELPNVNPWPLIYKLKQELEVVGIYASGHPLDDYALEYNLFVNCSLDKLEQVRKEGKGYRIAGIITKAQHAVNKKGEGYARFTLQDFNSSYEFFIGREQYLKHKDLIHVDQVVFIQGLFRKHFYRETLDFYINDMKQLSSLSQDKINALTLEIPMDTFSTEKLQDLNAVLDEHTGDQVLKIKLIGESELLLTSKNRSVTVSSNLVNDLKRLELKCKLN